MENQVAPIALFIYNRPEHTKVTLQALSQNPLAVDSILYVFADGAKADAIEADIEKIEAARQVVKNGNWCKQTILIERDINMGLANSIITGVSQVVEQHGKVIVLEDDVLPATGFLDYMNGALNMYEHEEQVGCIHAWNYRMDTSQQKEDTFFLKGADCWGWGTWKRGWDLFEPNGQKLLDKIIEQKLEYSFNRNGTQEFVKMLHEQIAGRNNSWAIRWHASLFLKNKFCLWPTKAIVTNIGLDGSGTHCDDNMGISQLRVDSIQLKPIDIEESKWFFESYQQLMAPKPAPKTVWARLRTLLRP